MIATRGTAGRIVLSVARQVGLSVLGTLTATAVMTTLQTQWAERTAAPVAAATQSVVVPSLTAGGKFAMRAIDGTEPEPFVALMQLPAVLPMFTAPAVPRLEPGASDATVAVAGPTGPEPEHAAPHRILRRATQPRPLEAHAVAMAPLPLLHPAPTEDPSIWSRSKSAYQTVSAWSGAMVDSLVP